jgi:hypothetical protein
VSVSGDMNILITPSVGFPNSANPTIGIPKTVNLFTNLNPKYINPPDSLDPLKIYYQGLNEGI